METTASTKSATTEEIRPFTFEVSDEELEDLRSRIEATKWPDREVDPSQGVQLETIQALAGYWGTDYDWRKFEERFAALPHFITEIDGVDIHFIHVRSENENALPLIVTHGWPGSTVEQLKIIDPLTKPTEHGASAGDAFHLVIPSLPGHGFSGKPTETGWDPVRIAKAWAVLMERLGYDRYVAQGGDWGNAVTEQLALLKPPGLLGIHTNMPATLSPEISKGVQLGEPAPGGPLGRREEGLRDPGPLLRHRHRLRGRNGQPAADALRHRGLAGRPGGLDARSRRGQLSADRARLRRESRRSLARRRPRQRHSLLADEQRGSPRRVCTGRASSDSSTSRASSCRSGSPSSPTSSIRLRGAGRRRRTRSSFTSARPTRAATSPPGSSRRSCQRRSGRPSGRCADRPASR